MRVTLKQIAELAGVSRGTVDRALYDRGRVNPEVAQRIKKIADDLGYQPNTAGRALALSKNPIIIGVIVQAVETPFMEEVIKGVEAAAMETELLGGRVMIRRVRSINPYEVMEYMEELSALGVKAIAMVPSDDQRVCEKINDFVENRNIPIVTLNTDAEKTKRLFYVGQDTTKSGRTAAGLMGEVLGGSGKIAIISGHTGHTALNRRIRGFKEVIDQHYSGIELLPVEYAYDDFEKGREIARRLLKYHPDIRGFLITASEDMGVCQVLEEMELKNQIKVICYDMTVSNIENLRKGNIDFLIGQDAYVQGYEPVSRLFRKFFQGTEPEKEYIYTDIEIKTKYSL